MPLWRLLYSMREPPPFQLVIAFASISCEVRVIKFASALMSYVLY